MRIFPIGLLSFLFLFSSPMALAAFVYLGSDRPAAVKLPAHYNANQKYPLLVILHGYGSTASETGFYLEVDVHPMAAPYIYIAPEGTLDAQGRRHWNAAPPQEPGEVNDSIYLQELIAQAKATFSVDPARIYVVGVSNGGFMAYRLACDTDGLLAGIVSIAGAMFSDQSYCRTKTPISVLQIHGTRDEIVPFESTRPESLGALASAQTWAQKNGCQSSAEMLNARDVMLQPLIPGIVLADGAYQAPPGPIVVDDLGAQETDELSWSACAQGVNVGLWRVNGGTHVPDYSGKNLIGQALEFLTKGTATSR
ncbi:alpha/beta hydrolase family esterase [Oligoflexus tunisiensis]|uniref:alpha/beta hydrolase family esterase n=1 Tax=Oligoflexus tunisiensis TaxID=708132 RepID=UPI00114CB6C8|nr:PHB depolymerase family esterase [Oligoflexus tunisiensis]